ncbi:MAG: hypothetical protein EXS64_08475 [Candidatus Latescibacteria bacterium]|nr:hypothetical protein [Candidatus Latescibacterota bacterium]
MTLHALLLLLCAALLHASWNLLVKRSRDKQVFTWCAMCAAAVLFSPLILRDLGILRVVDWRFVVGSAAVEVVYYAALARAYEHGDYSLVYPIARGSAPAFIALWAVLLLGEQVSVWGGLGIAMIALGIQAIHQESFRRLRHPLHLLRAPGTRWALAVGLLISVYSSIDKVAVGRIPPDRYIVLVFGLVALLPAPYLLARRGISAVVAEWRANALPIVAVGAMNLLSYLLVLQAMQDANVSYVGAVREMSVVMAALLGAVLMREGFGLVRIVAACVIFAGVIVIAGYG